MTSNDPVTFWGHKLGQIDHKGLDICGYLSGQVLDPWVKVKVKGQVDLWGHKVGHHDL